MPVTTSNYQRPDLRIPFSEWNAEAERLKMIALKMLPIWESGLGAGNFPRIPKEHLIPKVEDLTRAPRSAFKRDTFKFDQEKFAVSQHGFEELLDDYERALYAYAIDAELHQSQRAAMRVLRELEVNAAAAILSTTTFSTSAVGTAWTNLGASDPVADIRKAIKAVRKASGQMPNVVSMAWPAFQLLKDNASVIDRVKQAGFDDPKNLTRQSYAELFGVEEVVVAEPQQNTADEGQDAVLSDCWNPDRIFVGRVAKTSDPKEVCVGRTIHFSGDGSDPGIAMEQYRDEGCKSDVMRAFMNYEQKILYPECGYVLTGSGATS
jgi:hypothetical protein